MINFQPTTGLETLPPEILELLCSNLRNSDLKSLRRVSRVVSEPATTHLFHRFRLYPHRQSFDNLLRVAATAHLAQRVQHLKYAGAFVFVPATLTMMSLRILIELLTISVTEAGAWCTLSLMRQCV